MRVARIRARSTRWTRPYARVRETVHHDAVKPGFPKTHEAESRRGRWVLLAFRLPREPSTPRIAVWRKLKRLGVAQLLDGLVALPLDSRNREQLEWLAADVDGGRRRGNRLGRPARIRRPGA